MLSFLLWCFLCDTHLQDGLWDQEYLTVLELKVVKGRLGCVMYTFCVNWDREWSGGWGRVFVRT